MTVNEFVSSLLLQSSEEYEREINECINMHNNSVSNFMHQMSLSALITVLIKKEIITPDEYNEGLAEAINNNQDTTNGLTANRDAILEYIAANVEVNENLQEMYNDLEATNDAENAEIPAEEIIDTEEEVTSEELVEETNE